MTRAIVDRVIEALCAGRPRRDVLARVGVALAVFAAFYFGAICFLALEPVR